MAFYLLRLLQSLDSKKKIIIGTVETIFREKIEIKEEKRRNGKTRDNEIDRLIRTKIRHFVCGPFKSARLYKLSPDRKCLSYVFLTARAGEI